MGAGSEGARDLRVDIGGGARAEGVSLAEERN